MVDLVTFVTFLTLLKNTTNSMHFEQMSFLGQNAMSHVAPLT